MRVCSLCGAKDHPVILADYCNCKGGDDLSGHATGCKAIEHFIAVDIRSYQGKLTPEGTPVIPRAMASKGWSARGVFQGKQTIERFICRPCIRKQDDVYDIEEYKKRCGREAEQGTDLNMYEILCN